RVEVRKDEHVRAAGDRAAILYFLCRYGRHQRGVGLKFAVDRKSRRPGERALQRPDDLVDARMLRAPFRRERKQRYARLFGKQPAAALRRRERNVGKLL